MFRLVIFLVILVLGCDSFMLPSYMKKCTCDDTLAQCYVDNLAATKSHLKDGIEALAIPKLVPFHIDSLVLEGGENLTIKLTDVDVFDLDTFVMPTVILDLPARYMSITLSFDVIHITGMYEVDGRFLILPIKGHGPITVTIEEVRCTYGYNYELLDRDGVKYFRFPTAGFDLRFGKIGIQMDNLFDGNKTLGDQINAVLNANWEETRNLIKDPVSNVVKGVIYDVIHEFAEKVPAEEICFIPDMNLFKN